MRNSPYSCRSTMPLVLFLVVLFVACSGGSQKKDSPAPVDLSGSKALNITGLTMQGDTIALNASDACLKIVYFSQADCHYCTILNPKLDQLLELYNTDSTAVLEVFEYIAGSDTAGLAEYIKTMGPNPSFKKVLRINEDKTFINHYGINRTPTLFLVSDKDTILTPSTQSFDSTAAWVTRYLKDKPGC